MYLEKTAPAASAASTAGTASARSNPPPSSFISIAAPTDSSPRGERSASFDAAEEAAAQAALRDELFASPAPIQAAPRASAFRPDPIKSTPARSSAGSGVATTPIAPSSFIVRAPVFDAPPSPSLTTETTSPLAASDATPSEPAPVAGAGASDSAPPPSPPAEPSIEPAPVPVKPKAHAPPLIMEDDTAGDQVRPISPSADSKLDAIASAPPALATAFGSNPKSLKPALSGAANGHRATSSVGSTAGDDDRDRELLATHERALEAIREQNRALTASTKQQSEEIAALRKQVEVAQTQHLAALRSAAAAAAQRNGVTTSEGEIDPTLATIQEEHIETLKTTIGTPPHCTTLHHTATVQHSTALE